MSVSNPINHLGSIWYHTELSDVPYSQNRFLQQDGSNALSFYVTKTVLVGPKWFWSDQIDLNLTLMIGLFRMFL